MVITGVWGRLAPQRQHHKARNERLTLVRIALGSEDLRSKASDNERGKRRQPIPTAINFFKRNVHSSTPTEGRTAGAGWFFRNQPEPTDRTTLSHHHTVKRDHTIMNEAMS